MTKQEIDAEYLNLVKELEQEFYDFLPTRRALKAGKSEVEFQSRHGQLWQSQEDELIASGFMQPRITLEEEILTQKRVLAREKAIAAIKANQTGAPWGTILNDLAIVQGLIEPE